MNSLFKLTRMEVYFFSVVFILFPILTDFEYNLYERTGMYPSLISLLDRFIYGVFRTIPYLAYYKLILPSLFEKRYSAFLWRLIWFMVVLNGYMHYVVYGLIMHLTFLPEQIVTDARKWFGSNVIVHFSFIYIFRELLMVSFLGYYRQSTRQEKQLHALRQQQLQSELDYLKIQLQPHFFFNTLNNIYSLALQQSTRTAPLVAKHADIMRYMLYQAVHQTVSLQQEINFLTNYVAVESVRYSDKIQIQFETQGIHDSALIEPLLLLPFVENTFKHGIRQEVEKGYVHIVAVLVERELILESRNSKVFGTTHPANHRGIGLRNARKRLALLYPGQHELSIQEDNTTYTLQLRLTLRPND